MLEAGETVGGGRLHAAGEVNEDWRDLDGTLTIKTRTEGAASVGSGGGMVGSLTLSISVKAKLDKGYTVISHRSLNIMMQVKAILT